PDLEAAGRAAAGTARRDRRRPDADRGADAVHRRARRPPPPGGERVQPQGETETEPPANPGPRPGEADAARAEPGLPVLHPGRLSDRHLVQPRRLPQRLHHLLPADRRGLLSADAVRHEPCEGGEVQRGGAGVRGRRAGGTGRRGAVPAVAAELGGWWRAGCQPPEYRALRLARRPQGAHAPLAKDLGLDPVHPDGVHPCMRHLIRLLAPDLAAALVAAALAAVALRLWHADLDVPLELRDDNWTNVAWTQNVGETGSYARNDRLGAPHEMDMRGFPLPDPARVALPGPLPLLGCSAARAVNLFCLAGFPLAAVTSLWVLRRWGVAPLPAFVAAQLFALMPFHFCPGQGHLFLSAYYLLPLQVGLVLSVWRDGGPATRRAWVACAALALLAGGAGVYYAFYTCFFL